MEDDEEVMVSNFSLGLGEEVTQVLHLTTIEGVTVGVGGAVAQAQA